MGAAQAASWLGNKIRIMSPSPPPPVHVVGSTRQDSSRGFRDARRRLLATLECVPRFLTYELPRQDYIPVGPTLSPQKPRRVGTYGY